MMAAVHGCHSHFVRRRRRRAGHPGHRPDGHLRKPARRHEGAVDKLDEQLEQAQQLYGSLNSLTDMADVASLLNDPAIRKALPQDFAAIEGLFKGNGTGVFGDSASNFLDANSTYRTTANDFYAQEL